MTGCHSSNSSPFPPPTLQLTLLDTVEFFKMMRDSSLGNVLIQEYIKPRGKHPAMYRFETVFKYLPFRILGFDSTPVFECGTSLANKGLSVKPVSDGFPICRTTWRRDNASSCVLISGNRWPLSHRAPHMEHVALFQGFHPLSAFSHSCSWIASVK